MKLLNIINREPNPIPWREGDNIPWHEPGFSQRMLAEHLSQEHDAASRRFEKIDRHVAWIHQQVLGGQTGKILDLACGPGLYAYRFARLGYTCVGIDYSPASIAYAQKKAAEENLPCTYLHADLRQAEFGAGFDVAMMIFGEFNVFKRADIEKIITKAHQALNPGGVLILEPHTYTMIKKMGQQKPDWYSSPGGLFSAQPHLVLNEYFWDAESQTITIRYYVIAAESGAVIRYAQSMQAYTDDAYRDLLTACGFTQIQFYPSLIGSEDPQQKGLLAIVARK